MENGGKRKRIRLSTAKDEPLKKNTDCMFFLASPLACKKGNECKYRHAEGARANPRNCWYWLNGNCLNPNCLFRHPPLNGLLGTQGPSSGPVQPPSRPVAATKIPAGHAPYTTNKQSAPCYYFQRGHCLKGERCPFTHGPQAFSNPVLQHVTKVTTTTLEPPLQHSHKNQRQILQGNSTSTHLQGKITIPERSSPDVPNDSQSENDGNRGRPQGKLSPPRRRNCWRRHHERVNEKFAAHARSAGIRQTRTDDTSPLDSAGPKSFAEMKGAKIVENSQELSTESTSYAAQLNNAKPAKGASLRYPKDSLSFEDPKPLSIILKRKREAVSTNGASSGDENDQRDGENAAAGSVSVALSDVQSVLSAETMKDGHDNASSLEEHKDRTAKEDKEVGLNHGEEGSIYDGCSSAKEIFDGDNNMEVDVMEDKELKSYDQTYGESDYKAVEGGDSNSEYDENVCQENEDEFDDEDDFVKKVGALLACMQINFDDEDDFVKKVGALIACMQIN